MRILRAGKVIKLTAMRTSKAVNKEQVRAINPG